MTDTSNRQLDTLAKSTFLIIVILALIHFFKGVFMPFILAIFVSLSLLPLCRLLERWRINRVLASIIALILLITVILTLGLVTYSQLASFIRDLPDLTEKFQIMIADFSKTITSYFDITKERQEEIYRNGLARIAAQGGAIATGTFNALGGFLQFMATVPVYVVFMLIYRRHMRVFVQKSSSNFSRPNNMDIMDRVSGSIQQYVKGMMIVVSIVAVLNVTGLLILGLDYAIFLGIFSALLTVIPYIGIFIGAAIPIIVAFITKDSLFYPVAVLGIYVLIQFLEGNFITPNVMGKTVDLNPLAVIVSIVIAGYIAGILGMILAVPIVTMIKIVCAHVDGLKPIALLLGNELPEDKL